MARNVKKGNSSKKAVLAMEDWLAELGKQAEEWDHRQIGSLLDQVKNAGGRVPDRYYFPEETARNERERLGRAISSAFSMDLIERQFETDMHWKRRVQELTSIETKAKSILGAMSDDYVLRLMLTMNAPDQRQSDESIAQSLQLVSSRAASARKLLQDFGDAGGFDMTIDGPARQPTLFQSLGSVYDEYLESDPLSGLTKTYNKPGGPFVTFLRAAYHLDKRPEMNGEAIYKALQRAGFIGATDKA